jgi:hypothetical protein
VADAILGRVVHRAHPLTFGGPSRRKPNGNGSSAPKGDAWAPGGDFGRDTRVRKSESAHSDACNEELGI